MKLVNGLQSTNEVFESPVSVVSELKQLFSEEENDSFSLAYIWITYLNCLYTGLMEGISMMNSINLKKSSCFMIGLISDK